MFKPSTALITICLSLASVDANAQFNAGNEKITNVATPTNGGDAANKAYVDSNSGGGASCGGTPHGYITSSTNGCPGGTVLTSPRLNQCQDGSDIIVSDIHCISLSHGHTSLHTHSFG